MRSLLFILLLTGYTSIGQDRSGTTYCPVKDQQRTNPTAPYYLSEIDKQPEFVNGLNSFINKIEQSIKLPTVKENYDYRLIITFIIKEDGSYTNLEVVRNTAPANLNLGNQALKAISLYPKAKPGKIKGKTVETFNAIPLHLKHR